MEYVAAATITSSVALVGILFNAAIGWLTWRTTRDHHARTQELGKAELTLSAQLAEAGFKYETELARLRFSHEAEIERLKRSLDEAALIREKQLKRLRELQRSGERTAQRAKTLSHWHVAGFATDAETDAFVANAGDFLREAAGLFAEPQQGVPNIPADCSAPLLALRKAVVRVNLLLEMSPPNPSAPADRTARMDHALKNLNAELQAFVDAVERQESSVLPFDDSKIQSQAARRMVS